MYLVSNPQTKSSRRTNADDVYERLYNDISNWRLLPGDKLSEIEIAKQMEVSRQPVREAFIRLHNTGLLLVRPQKATEVRKISKDAIEGSRLVRLAVEVEVLRKVCSMQTESFNSRFENNLEQQKIAIDAGDTDTYTALDYQFHGLICTAADCEYAFGVIESSKAQVERLALLQLADELERNETYDDHCKLVECIKENKPVEAAEIMRHHLTRLDTVVTSVQKSHAEYFDKD